MRRLSYVCLSLIFFLSACGTNPTSTPPTVPTTGVPPATAVPPTEAPTTVAITPTTTSTTSAASSECTDAAQFVEDVTVPDYSHFDARATFTKTWRVKNIGTCSWTSAYSAVYSSGDALGPTSPIALSDTAPGATLDISVDMAAPASDGTYKIFYKLNNPAGQAMPVDDGNTIWAIITVGKVLVYSSPTPAPVSAAPSSGSGSTGSASCVTQANAGFISQTLNLINSARAANGQSAVTLNGQLSGAAQAHSADMACTGNLSHTGSDGSTPTSRIAASGVSGSTKLENIYAQPPQYGGNPQAAMNWWMSDAIHRDAILNAQVTQVGIGYAAYSASPLGGYFTVDFAGP
jgi:uncharacterized protein YkwD